MAENMRAKWKPLLQGELSREARVVLSSLYMALSQPSESWVSGWPNRQARGESRISLSNGYAGLSIFFAYASALGEKGNRERAAFFLNQSIERLAETEAGASLFSGFPGVAWASTHLQRLWALDSDWDNNGPVDTLLVGLLGKPELSCSYDLVEGLVGLGVYFLERLPWLIARDGLFLISEHLRNRAVRHGSGLTWPTDVRFIPASLQNQYTSGYFNLGMAHGVPGVVSLLSRMHTEAMGKSGIEPIIEGAICWMLEQEEKRDEGPNYPCWIGQNGDRRNGRYAWCYGDMCIIISLMSAARSLGNAEWENSALALARKISRESINGTAQRGTADPFFCHGSAGMAHMFNRLYQATGEESFKLAAIAWFKKLLAARKEGTGIAGYASTLINDEGINCWPNNPGILTGAAGVGLALLAAVSDVEPMWDKIFLLDLSPKPS